jgi:DNA-binding transcriptional LysR family regulator
MVIGGRSEGAVMDLRQMRYFLALAEEKHFGRAAERLSLSQPPLSQTIRQLEEELGAVLFERTSRRVELTPAGVALVHEARAILQRVDRVRTLVSDIASGLRGRLRIGFTGSMIYHGLPDILAAMGREAPDVAIKIFEMNSAEQADALKAGDIDIGFLHGRRLPDGLDGFLYHSEPFAACLPAAHPAIIGRRHSEVVRPAILAEENFILFSRHVSPEYYEAILAICRSAGFLPKVSVEARHWLSIIAFVAKGAGVALVPAALAASRIAGVSFFSIPDSAIQSQTWCVWSQSSPLKAICAPFLELTRRSVC